MTNAQNRQPLLIQPTEWTFAFGMYFLFEIDVSAIRLPMPRNVHPLEVRPGVGLIGVAVYSSDAGNLNGLPAFHEVGWTVSIEPDLSRDMPTPKFSFVVGNVSSECAEFVEHANTVDKMTVYHSPTLKARIDPVRFSASFSDERGPILDLWSTQKMAPRFQERMLWGQQVARRQDGDWFQAWSWKGWMFDHQQGHKAAVFHPHPIFDGIDIEGLGDRCYLQMMSKPGEPITETFYRPVHLRQ